MLPTASYWNVRVAPPATSVVTWFRELTLSVRPANCWRLPYGSKTYVCAGCLYTVARVRRPTASYAYESSSGWLSIGGRTLPLMFPLESYEYVPVVHAGGAARACSGAAACGCSDW